MSDSQSPQKRGTVLTFVTVSIDSDTINAGEIERIIKAHLPSNGGSNSQTLGVRAPRTSKSITESIYSSKKDAFYLPEAAKLLGVSPSFLNSQINAEKLSRIDAKSKRERKIAKDELIRFAGENAADIGKHATRMAGRKKSKRVRA